VRHGDLVFHACEARDTTGLTEIPGAALVTGSATGHSHELVGGPFTVWDLGDGRKLIRRLGERLAVQHQEHRTAELPEWSIMSVARQYDREHGWVDISD
jgi:hypothetical protein